MLAHCVSADIPIDTMEGYGVVPATDDWTCHVYKWQTGYVEKLRQDLIRVGLWDSLRASSCIQSNGRLTDVVSAVGSRVVAGGRSSRVGHGWRW